MAHNTHRQAVPKASGDAASHKPAGLTQVSRLRCRHPPAGLARASQPSSPKPAGLALACRHRPSQPASPKRARLAQAAGLAQAQASRFRPRQPASPKPGSRAQASRPSQQTSLIELSSPRTFVPRYCRRVPGNSNQYWLMFLLQECLNIDHARPPACQRALARRMGPPVILASGATDRNRF
jgi:hypothetical protein